jgi:two-component system, sensor histidine kinase and response regulator
LLVARSWRYTSAIVDADPPRRRRRVDTLPLLAQPAAPHVLLAGVPQDLAAELGRIVAASSLARVDSVAELADEIDAEEPDLVFVQLRDDAGESGAGSGLAIVRELKLLPETHFIPILALGPPTMRVPAYSSGADHFIELPLAPAELAARAVSLLRTATFARAMSQSRQELRLRRDWVRYLVHDLRNLLTKAIGDVALAMRKEVSDPEGMTALLARCEEELWRCSRLLNDLLDIDRIRKGMLNLRRSSTDLVALAGGVVESFRDAAARSHVSLVVAARSPAVMAEIDAALVERVMANLVANALRFAPEGSPVAVLVSGGDGRGVIEVENRGPSIPPEKASEIFEPFVKADDRPNAAGVGLGLAFCRLAVDLHGWTITVGEPDGGGARFRVTLPATGI